MRYYSLMLAICIVFLVIGQVRGYIVVPALSLDKLGDKCDLVAKVESLGSAEVADGAFEDLKSEGFAVYATKLRVISVLKGDASLREISFHHYDFKAGTQGIRMYEPQYYHFEKGENYLLFAVKTDTAGVFRTYTFYPESQGDQGQVWTANGDALKKGIEIKEVVWEAMKEMLADKDPKKVAYAIQHLEKFRKERFLREQYGDFASHDVLDLIKPFLASKDETISGTAVEAIGRGSPYWLGFENQGWLATVGKGKGAGRGWSNYPPEYVNQEGQYCRKELVALANSSASGELRGKAIRALGVSRKNAQDTELVEELRKWSADSDVAVRAAAAMVWADYPSETERAIMKKLAADKEATVRMAAAYGIACSQDAEMASVLEGMLADADRKVSEGAAIGLMSFDLKVVGEIIKRHLSDGPCSTAFTNVLAEANPAEYRDALVDVLSGTKREDELTWGGEDPRYTSWKILMHYLSDCDVEEMRAGKFDKYLDALEKPSNIGSSPYTDVYRFYFERGLTERREAFRKKALKEVTSYDLDMYFKQIDGRK